MLESKRLEKLCILLCELADRIEAEDEEVEQKQQLVKGDKHEKLQEERKNCP